MKYIIYLVYLNRFIFGATIILYATIFLGLMAQIILGGFQLLTAIFLMFLYNRINQSRIQQQIIYWCFVIAYGLLWFLDLINPNSDFYGFVFYILIPLSIAGFFTFILESIREENEN
ncbi:hypothetical protein KO506_04460 [Polaribacter vadi]|uniref:hypothetical protein n=1 Tax=Polaribacter TaxID=52959 RepID=UPI001C09C7D2|nr:MULTISPECIES: hypothetical protein [Polaribacter]MBU3010639.1 hypothetical protein [Polaribacter vadi]MDO6740450.1 hypothetical protein [Polaribacter sp. 1_MG-2023]